MAATRTSSNEIRRAAAGCAMIAAISVGAAADWEEARSLFVSFAAEILPNRVWRDRYLRYAEVFDALYDSNRLLWPPLDALD